jgi:hypothetical protein
MDLYKSGIAVEVAQDETLYNFLKKKLHTALKFLYAIFITVFIFSILFYSILCYC